MIGRAGAAGDGEGEEAGDGANVGDGAVDGAGANDGVGAGDDGPASPPPRLPCRPARSEGGAPPRAIEDGAGIGT